MYGAPSLAYPSEVIHSFNHLIEAIKLTQVARPRSRLAINLAGDEMAVNLLSDGLLELDGQVPSIAMEKRFEHAIKQRGADLKEMER